MEYTVVENPEEAGKASLKRTALQKDEIAFQAEFQYEETKLMSMSTASDMQNLKNVEIDAASKRRTADAYIQHSGISEEEILKGRLDFLTRLVHAQEHSHVTHSAELRVKESLGEPTANYDSVLEALDRGHKLANEKIVSINSLLAGK